MQLEKDGTYQAETAFDKCDLPTSSTRQGFQRIFSYRKAKPKGAARLAHHKCSRKQQSRHRLLIEASHEFSINLQIGVSQAIN